MRQSVTAQNEQSYVSHETRRNAVALLLADVAPGLFASCLQGLEGRVRNAAEPIASPEA
jgi:hypothetical protein